MDLFVREVGKNAWQRSAGMLGGLKAAEKASLDVALQTGNPAEDLDGVVATAWLFKLAGAAWLTCP